MLDSVDEINNVKPESSNLSSNAKNQPSANEKTTGLYAIPEEDDTCT